MLVYGAILEKSRVLLEERDSDWFRQMRHAQVPDLSGLEDSGLVQLTLSGDDRAFEALVRRHQKTVYNVLFQMVNSHEWAADLTQETFLRSFKGLHRFRQGASFRPWLLKIATNTCLNAIRDQKPSTSLEAMLDENPNLEPASTFDVESAVAERFALRQLDECLTKLPIRARQVCILRYQHDCSYEEIAEITGESVSSIKSSLFRSRQRLRILMLAGETEPEVGEPKMGDKE